MNTARNLGQDEAANGASVEAFQKALSRILIVTGQDYGFSSAQPCASAPGEEKHGSLDESQPHD